MKIKRIININNKGVAPALTLLLVIPIILTIVTAISFWSQNIVDNYDKTQDKLHEIRDDLDNFDIAEVINRTRVVYHDDFEDSEQNSAVWNIYCNSGASFIVGPGTEAEYSYYSGHLGAYIHLDSFPNNFCRIIKSFSKICRGNVSIEMAFTVDPNDTFKFISIYQNDNKNNATIRLDIKNEKLFLYDGENDSWYNIFENVYLFPDKLCWHTMKLIVNFDSDSSNSYSLSYVNFTLDGITYFISNHKLELDEPDVSDNPDEIFVSFTTESIGESETWIDDFLFIDLEPHKKIKCINWV